MRSSFLNRFNRPFVFRWFLILKLPIAWMSGLKIRELSEARARVSMRYGFWNKNPFNSMYFACQAMAAEMSTGILALGHTDNQSVKISLLVKELNSTYKKKAVGAIEFICEDGLAVKDAVERASKNDEPILCKMISHGYDEKGDCVSSFEILWTFKRKSKA